MPQLSFPISSRASLIRPLLLLLLGGAASSPARAQQPAPTHVTIESADPTVSLLRIDGMKSLPMGRHSQWVAAEDLTHVCRNPCGMMVDPNFNYRIGGPGILQSEPIVFPDGGAVRLRVKVGSVSRRVNGVIFTTMGVALAGAGGMLLGMSALVGSSSTQTPTSSPAYNWGAMQPMSNNRETGPDMMKAGGAILGVGAALLATGIALWATSGTHVEQIADTPGVAIGSGVRLTGSGLAF